MRTSFVAIAVLVLLVGGFFGSLPARADQTVQCREVDDLAEVTFSDTITVSKSFSGKECYFSASIKAGSKANNFDNVQAIRQQMTTAMTSLANGSIVASDAAMQSVSLLLVGPFLDHSLDDPGIQQLADFLDNNHGDFLRECLAELQIEGSPQLSADQGASCGFVAPSEQSTEIFGFPLAVRASEPVFVLAVEFDGVFFAIFVPQSVLARRQAGA